MAHDYATKNAGLAGVEESRFFLSSDSLARTENGQLVPRLVVLRCRSAVSLGGRQDRSHAYVTVRFPLLSVVDFPVVKAYPLVTAHALMELKSASRDR